MILTRRVVPTFQLFEKKGSIPIEGRAIGGQKLYLASCECRWGLNVRNYVVFMRTVEDYASKTSSGRHNSGTTEAITCSLVVWLLDFLLRLR